jgi:predicted esterase
VIEEHHLDVPRSARYFTIGTPGPAITEVWFALHGYAQLAASFARQCLPLEASHRLVIAPEGLSRFYIGDHTRPATADTRVGASWMTREDRLNEITDYIRYLDLVARGTLERLRQQVSLHVLGFSQGTATATRWTTRGQTRIDRLILWGAPTPTDLDPALDGGKLRALDVVLVVGDEDPFVTPKVVSREEERLAAMGVRYRVVRYRGIHALDPETLKGLGART